MARICIVAPAFMRPAAFVSVKRPLSIRCNRCAGNKNILIFKRTVPNLDKLGKYFVSSERKTIKVREATFELLIGNKFNYSLYREEVLKKVNHDFYAIPDWLPVGQCEFKNKYGFNDK